MLAKTILVVEDEPVNLQLLSNVLTAQGYTIRSAGTGTDAIASALSDPPDLILLDINIPEVDGYGVCQRLKTDRITRDIPVIFISGLEDPQDKVLAFRVGGLDYITKPFQTQEVLARVENQFALRDLHLRLQQEVTSRAAAESKVRKLNAGLETRVQQRTEQLQQALAELEQLKNRLQQESIYLREEIKANHNFEEIVGNSRALHDVMVQVQQVATTNATVLILGETGTGKELIARAVHNGSRRFQRPLVKVNCAALPPTLIESELFGHEKGSFTGATNKKIGRFELADHSSIFLDEIGDLALDLQAKLLRVLQEGEFERLGSSKTLTVDTRVIAATNRDLPDLIELDKFREDLYYRLNVFPIRVPPLRERIEDIPLLVNAFVDKFTKQLGKPIDSIPQSEVKKMQNYHWPGNIRELQNVIERAVILSPSMTLMIEEPLLSSKPPKSTNKAQRAETLEQVERDHIVSTLEAVQWRVSGPQGAAEKLGINASTLRSRMRKMGIQQESAANA